MTWTGPQPIERIVSAIAEACPSIVGPPAGGAEPPVPGWSGTMVVNPAANRSTWSPQLLPVPDRPARSRTGSPRPWIS